MFRFWGALLIPKWLIEVPDIFQYFLDICWNFQKSTKYWHFSHLFYVEMLENTRGYGDIFREYYFSYLNISKIQNFKILETTGHNKWKLCLDVVLSWWSKTIVLSQGFIQKNRILRWWNLEKLWKSGNLKT